MADCVVANSRFTAGVVERTFVQTSALHSPVAVVYPCVKVQDRQGLAQTGKGAKSGRGARGKSRGRANSSGGKPLGRARGGKQPVFLSINRFERKKALHIAVKAMCHLKTRMAGGETASGEQGKAASPVGLESVDAAAGAGAREEAPVTQWSRVKLVVAGGYDEAVSENVEYHRELKQMAVDAGLTVADVEEPFSSSAQVEFLRSFSDAQKTLLLEEALAVLYTPPNEHFGIVPLEAMEAGCPVLADRSGGPTETVRHGVTGFLIPSGGEVVAGAYQAGAATAACDECATGGAGDQSQPEAARRRAGSRSSAGGVGNGASLSEGDKADSEPTGPEGYAAKMEQLVRNPELARELGDAGRKRVIGEFSRDALGRRLDGLAQELVVRGSKPASGVGLVTRLGSRRWWSGLGCFVLFLAAALSALVPLLLGAFGLGLVDADGFRLAGAPGAGSRAGGRSGTGSGDGAEL